MAFALKPVQEDFTAISNLGDISWRSSKTTALIDYEAALVVLRSGQAIRLAAETKAVSWRKRATLLQAFRNLGVAVKSRCVPNHDGTYEVIVALREEV